MLWAARGQRQALQAEEQVCCRVGRCRSCLPKRGGSKTGDGGEGSGGSGKT